MQKFILYFVVLVNVFIAYEVYKCHDELINIKMVGATEQIQEHVNNMMGLNPNR